jgi:RNA polymerase sigma factor (sigma-70 family)
MSQVVVATTHDRLSSDAGLLSNEEEPTPEDHAARAEQVEMLTELLQEMDPHRREVLQLSYVADLRTVDIGAKLNMHKSSVTKLRTRTLASLRKQFDVADVNQEEEDDAG